MLTHKEMIAEVEALMRKACEEAGCDYDEFIAKLDAAFDARFEIVEV
jgi:hypothetical protein